MLVDHDSRNSLVDGNNYDAQLEGNITELRDRDNDRNSSIIFGSSREYLDEGEYIENLPSNNLQDEAFADANVGADGMRNEWDFILFIQHRDARARLQLMPKWKSIFINPNNITEAKAYYKKYLLSTLFPFENRSFPVKKTLGCVSDGIVPVPHGSPAIHCRSDANKFRSSIASTGSAAAVGFSSEGGEVGGPRKCIHLRCPIIPWYAYVDFLAALAVADVWEEVPKTVKLFYSPLYQYDVFGAHGNCINGSGKKAVAKSFINPYATLKDAPLALSSSSKISVKESTQAHRFSRQASGDEGVISLQDYCKRAIQFVLSDPRVVSIDGEMDLFHIHIGHKLHVTSKVLAGVTFDTREDNTSTHQLARHSLNLQSVCGTHGHTVRRANTIDLLSRSMPSSQTMSGGDGCSGDLNGSSKNKDSMIGFNTNCSFQFSFLLEDKAAHKPREYGVVIGTIVNNRMGYLFIIECSKEAELEKYIKTVFWNHYRDTRRVQLDIDIEPFKGTSPILKEQQKLFGEFCIFDKAAALSLSLPMHPMTTLPDFSPTQTGGVGSIACITLEMDVYQKIIDDTFNSDLCAVTRQDIDKIEESNPHSSAVLSPQVGTHPDNMMLSNPLGNSRSDLLPRSCCVILFLDVEDVNKMGYPPVMSIDLYAQLKVKKLLETFPDAKVIGLPLTQRIGALTGKATTFTFNYKGFSGDSCIVKGMMTSTLRENMCITVTFFTKLGQGLFDAHLYLYNHLMQNIEYFSEKELTRPFLRFNARNFRIGPQDLPLLYQENSENDRSIREAHAKAFKSSNNGQYPKNATVYVVDANTMQAELKRRFIDERRKTGSRRSSFFPEPVTTEEILQPGMEKEIFFGQEWSAEWMRSPDKLGQENYFKQCYVYDESLVSVDSIPHLMKSMCGGLEETPQSFDKKNGDASGAEKAREEVEASFSTVTLFSKNELSKLYNKESSDIFDPHARQLNAVFDNKKESGETADTLKDTTEEETKVENNQLVENATIAFAEFQSAGVAARTELDVTVSSPFSSGVEAGFGYLLGSGQADLTVVGGGGAGGGSHEPSISQKVDREESLRRQQSPERKGEGMEEVRRSSSKICDGLAPYSYKHNIGGGNELEVAPGVCYKRDIAPQASSQLVQEVLAEDANVYFGPSLRDIYFRCCDQLGCRPNSYFYNKLPINACFTSCIEEVDLTSNYIGHTGIKALLIFLQYLPQLKAIVFDNMSLDNEDVAAIVSSLTIYPCIMSVSLKNNPKITLPAVKPLLWLVNYGNKNITTLGLQGTSIGNVLIAKIQNDAAKNLEKGKNLS